MMRAPIGLPLPMPRGGPMDGGYRFSHQGPMIMSGGPPGMGRPPMQMTLGPRGPMPGNPMVLSRMPGPHQPGMHPQQQVLVMQRPGMPPGANGPPLVRAPIRPGPQGTFIDQSPLLHLHHCSGVPVPSNSMTVMPGQHPSNYYPGQQGQGVSIHSHACPTLQHSRASF